MRALRITIGLILVAGLGLAATPEEESSFLKAVHDAYAKKDKDAIIALYCWDGVEPQYRAMFPNLLNFQISEREITSVYFRTNFIPTVIPQTNNGVVYVPNLTPTKQLVIEHKVDPDGMYETLRLDVGEKDGKLMIANHIPRL